MDKNFNTLNLKLKKILMEFLLKGCSSKNCNFYNIPMTYEAMIKHLNNECNKIIGTCE